MLELTVELDELQQGVGRRQVGRYRVALLGEVEDLRVVLTRGSRPRRAGGARGGRRAPIRARAATAADREGRRRRPRRLSLRYQGQTPPQAQQRRQHAALRLLHYHTHVHI